MSQEMKSNSRSFFSCRNILMTVVFYACACTVDIKHHFCAENLIFILLRQSLVTIVRLSLKQQRASPPLTNESSTISSAFRVTIMTFMDNFQCGCARSFFPFDSMTNLKKIAELQQ